MGTWASSSPAHFCMQFLFFLVLLCRRSLYIAMDLCLPSSLPPCHLHRSSSRPPPAFACAPRLASAARCSARADDGSSAPANTSPLPPQSSWLQNDSATQAYSGWTWDEFQSNGRSLSGWVKMGGVVFLAIGFALGARSMYTGKAFIKELAVPLPVKEQIVSPTLSDLSAVPENLDGSSALSKTIENDQETTMKQEKESHADVNVSEVHQEDITPGQVFLLSEDVEDCNGKEGNFTVSSSDATDPTSKGDLSYNQGFTGTSSDDLIVTLPPSENVVQEDCFVSSPFEPFVYESEVAIKAPGGIGFSNVVVLDEDDTKLKDVYSRPDSLATLLSSLGTSNIASSSENDLSGLSFKEKVTLEGIKMSELHCDPDMSNSFIVESAGEFNLPYVDVTILHEPCMPDSSLHDTDGSVQSVTPHLEEFSSSSKKNGLEKKSSQLHEWDEKDADVGPFGSALEFERWQFSSADIPAPATPSAALRKTLGKVVVPAPVDHIQEQALAALQALKVIEAGVEPGAICTRREYARWLIATSAILSRGPAHKVFPAMYIENTSKLAYDDVLPEDPDFPFIQGLAEAGLISSKLSTQDRCNGKGNGLVLDESSYSVFSPDSPLTRQDLITWKLALERQRSASSLGKEAISGFIDIDKIHHDALPALAADLSAGDKSIISLAFGYTRRFQPEKPVTKAQAAIALATGEAWELVSEELARLDAESIAEAAVAAELALEMKAQQEVATAYNELLEEERVKGQAAATLAETTRAELEKLKAEREEERFTLLKERAALDSEKELLSILRLQVEEQALAFSTVKVEVEFEREQVEKLHKEAEQERETLSKVRSELEIEKNALSLARVWAEDEARKALAHAKALEQARKRWEDQGVQVHVTKELDESNIPFPSWYYSEVLQPQKAPTKGFVTRSKDFGRVVVNAFIRFLQLIYVMFLDVRNRAIGLTGKVGEKIHDVKMKGADVATRTVEGIQQRASSVVGFASGFKEGTRKVVDEWKEGAERLAQKLKIS